MTMTGCVGSMDALRVVTSPKMGAVSRRPPGHVAGEHFLTEGVDVAVGDGLRALPECMRKAADAAEEIEQGDAVGHGCIVATKLSARSRGWCAESHCTAQVEREINE